MPIQRSSGWTPRLWMGTVPYSRLYSSSVGSDSRHGCYFWSTGNFRNDKKKAKKRTKRKMRLCCFTRKYGCMVRITAVLSRTRLASLTISATYPSM